MFNLKPAQNQAAAVRPNYQSTIATHEVLRKTYFLLSLTLLFSAAMAAVSMETGFAIACGALPPCLRSQDLWVSPSGQL